jgi:RNA polymerase sigma factor (sigma-70 family)
MPEVTSAANLDKIVKICEGRPMNFSTFWRTYDPTVRAVIRKFIPRHIDDPDDLSQEMWAQFIRGQLVDGVQRSYWEIYNPRMASPKTFMWEFTRRRCLQRLSRSERTPTDNAYSIQNQPGEDFVVGIVDPETTAALGHDPGPAIEFQDLYRRAEQAIRSQPQRGRRDLKWVWALVTRGYRQDQIAAEMQLSEGTISICMDLIRQIPEVQQLREFGAERGWSSSGLLSR